MLPRQSRGRVSEENMSEKILSIDPVAFEIFGKEIRWYALIIAASIITVFLLCCYRGKKKGYKDDVFIDLTFTILIPGVIGARLLYVFTNWSHYANDPVRILYVWEGGLAILGGFITAIPCFIIYCYKKHINLWELVDIIAPCFALAQCIGRWGNFVNQELYGGAVLDPALQFFPVSVFIDRTQQWHYAAFFYESVWSLMTFLVLSFIYYKKKHNKGDIVLLYLVFYSVIRIILDAVKIEGTLTNQLICVGLIVIVAVVYFTKRKMANDEAFKNKVHSKISPRLLSDYEPTPEQRAAYAPVEKKKKETKETKDE